VTDGTERAVHTVRAGVVAIEALAD